jgi:DNA-binding Xre family transcriptional regulator
MGLEETLRKKLILYKDKYRLSNKKVGDILGCTGQSVGSWLVKKDAYISNEFVIKIKDLTKEINSSSNGIKNTSELRQILFNKAMKKRYNYENISNRIGLASPDQLEVLFSDEGADFTAKTLSYLCAILEISEKDLPISSEEKSLLFIDTARAKTLIKKIPYCEKIKSFNKDTHNSPFGFDGSFKEIEAFKLDWGYSHIATRYFERNEYLCLEKGDLIILSDATPEDGDLLYIFISDSTELGKYKGGQHIVGKYNSNDNTISTSKSQKFQLPDGTKFSGYGDIAAQPLSPTKKMEYVLKFIRIIRESHVTSP